MAGSEVARLVAAFEEDQVDGGPGAKQNLKYLHHEQRPGVQTAFLKDSQSVTVVIHDMDNSFWRKAMTRQQRYHEVSCWNSNENENQWLGQYGNFAYELLSKCTTHVTYPCQKHHAIIQPPSSESTFERKTKFNVQSMKSGYTLFSRLWLDMVMWTSSYAMKIMLAHHLCHWEVHSSLV